MLHKLPIALTKNAERRSRTVQQRNKTYHRISLTINREEQIKKIHSSAIISLVTQEEVQKALRT